MMNQFFNYIFPKDVFLFLTDNANASAVAKLQTSTALRPATTVTGLTAEPTYAALHSFMRAFGIAHPATSPLQPRRQTLADKLAHAVNNGVDHRRMAMAHAVHCQGTCYCIQGDHLPPGHTFKRGREREAQNTVRMRGHRREVLRSKSRSSFGLVQREVTRLQSEYLKLL